MERKKQLALFSFSNNEVEEKVGEEDVRGTFDPNNTLNDLTGKEWIKSTKSWFICNPKPRKKDEILHPAKFPEELVEEFILFFTKKGQYVFDPFLGSGSTLVACNTTLRRGYGIELSEKWARIARERVSVRRISDPSLEQTVVVDDSRQVDRIAEELDWPKMDFCITSPPYGNILRTSRGGVESVQKKRAKRGLPEYYSEDSRDLGNLDSSDDYLEGVCEVFAKTKGIMREGAYVVVVLQNARTIEGNMEPIAWKVALRLCDMFHLKQERIWCQDNKPLGIWGYPHDYVSNVHHHYCLILKKGS